MQQGASAQHRDWLLSLWCAACRAPCRMHPCRGAPCTRLQQRAASSGLACSFFGERQQSGAASAAALRYKGEGGRYVPGAAAAAGGGDGGLSEGEEEEHVVMEVEEAEGDALKVRAMQQVCIALANASALHCKEGMQGVQRGGRTAQRAARSAGAPRPGACLARRAALHLSLRAQPRPQPARPLAACRRRCQSSWTRRKNSIS